MLWTEAANINWMESLTWIFVVMAVFAAIVGLWRRMTGASSEIDKPTQKAA
ncbi:hypothetical protein [Nitrospira sp. Kam-Ns4a]